MMAKKQRLSLSTEAVRLLSSAAVEMIMNNEATAIGRIGEFSVAVLCRDISTRIHAVASVRVVDNDVDIELFNNWQEALKQFAKLVRAT